MDSSLHDIFRRYVNDDCTEDEIRVLLDHFHQPTEELVLKGLIIKELESENHLIYEPSDTDVRLESVYRSIQKEIKPQHKYYRVAYLRYAAAILLLIAAGLYWMIKTRTHVPADQQLLADNVLPGTDQATLTIGNGKPISLHDTSDTTLLLSGGGKIRKAADGQIIYEPGNHNTHPEKNTIKTPVGGQWQVILPDGTHVWLNASSTITYEVPFNSKERKVELSGEAYFEVNKNSTQPFKVISRNQEVRVLGTAFNVMAYPDEQTVQTTLVQGAVLVASGDHHVQLQAGDQTITAGNNIQVKHDVDTDEAVSWKDGYFKFNGNLEDIMNRIARWYDVEIIYKNKPVINETFEGEISRKRSLKDVLHIIEGSGRVHFNIDGRTVTVE